MDLIPYSCQSISEDDVESVAQVLRSSYLTQGPELELFERALTTQFNLGHAVCCSSGTAALHLAYAAAGISANSMGFVPAVTFSATANAFRYLGARVIFCDIDPKTGLIDPASLGECLDTFRPDTRAVHAIAPVSFAGKVAPLAACRELAKLHRCKVIEDASHSPGAFRRNGAKDDEASISSPHCDASCLSFHPVKHICAGEGGALLTNDSAIADKAKKLRSHGITRPFSKNDAMPWYYQQDELGWNYRMTDLQAALGRSQLQKIEHSLLRRREIARKYHQAFSKEPFISHFHVPEPDEGHAWHLYIIRFINQGARDLAYKFLKERGVGSQVHYIPLYRHPYYKNLIGEIHLPGAEAYFQSCLSIPMFPQLSEKQLGLVIEALYEFTEKG